MRVKISSWVAWIAICGLPVFGCGSMASGALPLPSVVQEQEPGSAPSGEQAAEASPKPPELTLEQRADVLMARKAYAEAADYYRRALNQVRNKDAALWNKLGIAYQQQMNYRAARKAYNQSIHQRKDFPEPLNNLGTTYFLTNNYKKAVKYYLKAIELNPNSAPLHLNLGSAYLRLKKYTEFEEESRTALMLDPNALTGESRTGVVVRARDGDVAYYFHMAKVFASLGRVEEAVRHLRRAFEEGFKDRKRVEEDDDFKKISESAAFIELMKNPPGPPK